MKNLLKKLNELNISITQIDGRLDIKGPKGVVTHALLAEIKQNKEKLLTVVPAKESINMKVVPIPEAPVLDHYPLTPSQKRIWILSQFEKGNQASNISSSMTLEGVLDKDKLEEAFNCLINKYEILRTCFKYNKAKKIVQFIIAEGLHQFTIKQQDFSEKTKEEIDQYLEKENATPFNLEELFLLRASLLKTGDKTHILNFTIHHIISDGWSLELIISEIIRIYNCLRNNESYDSGNSPIQYKEYTLWLLHQNKQEKYKRSRAYWLNQFKEEIPVVDFPTSKKRPRVRTNNGKVLKHTFSKGFLNKIRNFSSNNKLTLFMTLLGGLNGLLFRYTNQTDLILGTPVAGREHPSLENQIGLFINTLAIRTRFNRNCSFGDLIKLQKELLLEAFRHKEFPFSELVNELDIKKDLSRSVLFDIMVVFQRNAKGDKSNHAANLSELSIAPYNIELSTSKFDLSFIFVEKEDLELCINYNSDLYEASFMKNVFLHFEEFLKNGIDKPGSELTLIPFLPGRDKDLLLHKFNDRKFKFPKDETLVSLFDAQVKCHPDRIAIVFQDKKISYLKLDKLSNQFANFIVSKQEIKAEDLVGVKLERSDWLIVSLLAILKLGAGYVPIDPNYPDKRIAYIENDSNCKLIIEQVLIDEFKHMENISESLDINTLADNIAYVIYTSGSTGKPKGVLIEHQGIVNTCLSQIKENIYHQNDRCLQFASQSFDASIWEIFNTLLCGASLYIVTDNVKRDTNKFITFLNENSITNATLPPAYLKLLDISKIISLKTLITAGEEADRKQALAFSAKGKFYNAYGPTETSICASVFSGKIEELVPIGKPIANTELYILSEQNQLQPIGVTGELCIAGAGLARGYLNKQELTDQKFVPHPFIAEKRLYKTGDLARWLPDGNIDFIGRKDNQVKLRGYRIELGEVEKAILKFADIKEVVVNVNHLANNDKILVGFIVTQAPVDYTLLKDYLTEELPAYMVPGYFIELDAVPLTHNGKIDRKTLDTFKIDKVANNNFIAPDTDTEKKIAQIWKEVLAVERIGKFDNFFELGGHSLKLIEAKTKIKEALGKELSLNDLLACPTLEKQSELVSGLAEKVTPDITHDAMSTDFPLTPLQKKIWFASRLEEGNKAYNMVIPLMHPERFSEKKFMERLENLVSRYRILRTSFHEENGRVFHRVSKNIDLKKRVIKYSIAGQPESMNDFVKEKTTEEYNYCFDHEMPGLFRILLIEVGENQFAIVFNIHHIIADKHSIGILKTQLLGTENDVLPASAPACDFLDFSAWVCENIKTNGSGKSLRFLKSSFKNVTEVSLPISNNIVSSKSFAGQSVSITNLDFAVDDVQTFCKEHNITLFSFWAFAWGMTLHLVAGRKAVVISSPVSARVNSDFNDQPGVFLNTLHLVIKDFEGCAIKIALDNFFKYMVQAIEHQFYPTEIALASHQSNVLDQFFIIYNDQGNQEMANNVEADHRSKFPLALIVTEAATFFDCKISYNTDLYNNSDVALLGERFVLICNQILNKEISNINDLNIEFEFENTLNSIQSQFNF